MKIERIFLTCILMTSSFSLLAAAQSSGDLAYAMRQAVNSPAGTYSGRVTGEIANDIRSQIGANVEIFVNIDRVYEFKQEGCGRFRIVLTAPEKKITLEDGTVTPFEFTMLMNMCPDGSPPMEFWKDGRPPVLGTDGDG